MKKWLGFLGVSAGLVLLIAPIALSQIDYKSDTNGLELTTPPKESEVPAGFTVFPVGVNVGERSSKFRCFGAGAGKRKRGS
jgi:hypothetical protein